MIETLQITRLDDTAARRARAALDLDHVARIATALKAGRKVDPVQAIRHGDEVLVYDGAHRLKAHRVAWPLLVRVMEIAVNVTGEGGHREALALALGCNQEHGLPLSRADLQHRREIVMVAEMARRSRGEKARAQMALAEIVGCSHTYIGEWLAAHGVETRRKKPAANPETAVDPRQVPIVSPVGVDMERSKAPDSAPGAPSEAHTTLALPSSLRSDSETTGVRSTGGAVTEEPTRAQLADRVEHALRTLRDLGGAFALREDWPTGGGEQDIVSWLDALDDTPREELAEVLPVLESAVQAARRGALSDSGAAVHSLNIPSPDPTSHPTDDDTAMLGEALDAARADLAECQRLAIEQQAELCDQLDALRNVAEAGAARNARLEEQLQAATATTNAYAIEMRLRAMVAGEQEPTVPPGWPEGWTVRPDQPIADDPTMSAQVTWFSPRAGAEVPGDDLDEETTARGPRASADLRREHARLLAWAVSRLPTHQETPCTPPELLSPSPSSSASPTSAPPPSAASVLDPLAMYRPWTRTGDELAAHLEAMDDDAFGALHEAVVGKAPRKGKRPVEALATSILRGWMR